MKFLIDECLSPSLVNMAWDAGYVQSAHITHRGMGSWKDYSIMKRILEENWTLVTHNANDFRPKDGSSSKKPCYVGITLHAGLVCLNMPKDSNLIEHQKYFASCLEFISDYDNIINRILEIDPDSFHLGLLKATIYDFPKS